jgi:hypothetical protein
MAPDRALEETMHLDIRGVLSRNGESLYAQDDLALVAS